jgi:hypothetical protein
MFSTCIKYIYVHVYEYDYVRTWLFVSKFDSLETCTCVHIMKYNRSSLNSRFNNLDLKRQLSIFFFNSYDRYVLVNAIGSIAFRYIIIITYISSIEIDIYQN